MNCYYSSVMSDSGSAFWTSFGIAAMLLKIGISFIDKVELLLVLQIKKTCISNKASFRYYNAGQIYHKLGFYIMFS